eukprot:3954791-Amphidinium_carterae.1
MSSHSVQATALSWAAKAGVDISTRRPFSREKGRGRCLWRFGCRFHPSPRSFAYSARGIRHKTRHATLPVDDKSVAKGRKFVLPAKGDESGLESLIAARVFSSRLMMEQEEASSESGEDFAYEEALFSSADDRILQARHVHEGLLCQHGHQWRQGLSMYSAA